MLGSSNGPAYGFWPKLVVMKVLCKLRWRKIRHLPSLSLSSFNLCIPLSLPVFLFIFSSALSIFLTRCVFPSVCHILSISSPFSFLHPFHFLSFRLFLHLCLPFSCPPLTLPRYQNSFVPHLLFPHFNVLQFFSGTPESVSAPTKLHLVGYFIYSHPHCSLPPLSWARFMCVRCCVQMGQEVLSGQIHLDLQRDGTPALMTVSLHLSFLVFLLFSVCSSFSPCFFSLHPTKSLSAGWTGSVFHVSLGCGEFQATFHDMANVCQYLAPCPTGKLCLIPYFCQNLIQYCKFQ